MQIIPEYAAASSCETYHGLILTLQDALMLLEGTRRQLLPSVKRRLNDVERKHIRAGSVYAWNETECGMKRWTDGKNWLASKVKGPFLTYQEHDEFRNVKVGGLIKQIFSLTTKQNDKLHLIAYYDPQARAKGVTTQVPSQDPRLAKLRLDPAVYLNDILHCNDVPRNVFPPYVEQQPPVPHYPHYTYYGPPQLAPLPYAGAVLQPPYRQAQVYFAPQMMGYQPVLPNMPVAYSGGYLPPSYVAYNQSPEPSAFTYDTRKAPLVLLLPSPTLPPALVAPEQGLRPEAFPRARLLVPVLLPMVNGGSQYHPDDRTKLNALDKMFSV